MARPPILFSLVLVAAAVVGSAVAIAAESATRNDTDEMPPTAEQAEQPDLHPVTVRRHPAPRVPTGATNADGEPLTVSCSTCHAMLEPDSVTRHSDQLEAFHQGLAFDHGSKSCLACHNPDDYDSLRLADGTSIAFEASIDLCSQCHGPQRRDFDRGAHGGMTGYWDLSRGERIRNTCLDCHDAHVPKFQGAIPMPGPYDRFLRPVDHQGAGHE